MPVGTIIVAHQIGGRRVPGECLCHLLSQPFRRRIAGHRKPQQLPPSMADNKKGKQPLEAQGWNHAQIDRRNRVRMVAQECPPALRMAVHGARSCTSKLLTLRPRIRASAARRGSAERPTMGSPCSFDELVNLSAR